MRLYLGENSTFTMDPQQENSTIIGKTIQKAKMIIATNKDKYRYDHCLISKLRDHTVGKMLLISL